MAKILLVEDDKSLREIYGVRLMAEGYEIVSAGDGEEALAMAIKERPDLIVSDVMMPKISGFDMLDILRSTTETKNVKVIMMTALSSEDQRARGEALGADRYLVKSQVGIEDVVRTVHDVLGDSLVAPTPVAIFPPATAPAAPAPFTAPTFEAPLAPAPAPLPEPSFAPAMPTPTAMPEAPAPFETPSFEAPAPAFEAPVQSAYDMPNPTPAPAPSVYDAPAPFETPAADPTFVPIPPTQEVAAPAPFGPQAPSPYTVSATPAPAPFEAPAPIPQPQFTAPLPAPVAMQTPTPMPQPTAPFSSPAPASLGERVIAPLSAPAADTASVLDLSSQMEQALNNAASPFGPPPAL